MNSSTLLHTASLHVIANTMKRDFGLDELSEEEPSIVYGIFLASPEESRLESHVIMRHLLCRHLSHATFYRSLRSLVEKEIVVRSGTRKASAYSLQLE